MAEIKNVVVIGVGPTARACHLPVSLTRGNRCCRAEATLGRPSSTGSSREASKTSVPQGVRVLRTDYSSESLVGVLRGQDAVVSAIRGPGVATQIAVIEAAEAAGVKRFIPSEFGNDNAAPTQPDFKALLAHKVSVMTFLKARAAANPNFTWTTLANGVFIDWVLQTDGAVGFFIGDRRATLYDSGEEAFTGTLLNQVGLATARILKYSSQTANVKLKIKSVTTSQNQILAAFKKATGTEWAVREVRTTDVLKDGKEKLSKGDMSCFVDFMKVHLCEDGAGRGCVTGDADAANGLLGIPLVDIDSVVRGLLN